MRLVSVLHAATALLLTAITARAQPNPPAQDYVVAIGSSPLKAPATADFAPGASFTMEGWVYLTGNFPFAWLMGKNLPTSGVDPFVSFALLLDNTGTKLSFVTSTSIAGTYRDVASPTALPLRTWTHVAAVLENGTMRLLVNGQIVATGTAAGAPATTPTVPFSVGIAFKPDGGTNYSGFPGHARQVRFWSVARSAAQISAALSQPVPADRAGLVAVWPLDESSGTTARDASGNGRPLTVGSGSIAAVRTALLEAGPFFSTTTTSVPGNALVNGSDAVLIDFDSDGDLDFVSMPIVWPPTVPETRARLRAFRNNAGSFADATDAVLGNLTMVHPRHAQVADFNGDGRADLVIGGHGTDTPPFPGEQSKLFIQSADGRLVDETATRLPQRSDFTHNVGVGDIDGDGDLDLYMANVNGGPGTGGPCFYLNNGSGVFTVANDRLPVDIATRAGGVVYDGALLVDANGDGRPDLVLGGGGGPSHTPNLLLINDGSGRFARDARFTLPPKAVDPTASSPAVASADFDGNGAPDLLLGTTGGSIVMPSGEIVHGYSVAGLQLLLNRGDGTFYDASSRLNVAFAGNDAWVKWTRIADLDGDTRPDIVLQGVAKTGAFSRTILLNRGAGHFVDASNAIDVGYTWFLAPADVDRDGVPDLVGANDAAITVARGRQRLQRSVFQTSPDEVGRMTNLSVRTQAGTGDQTLIAGFALGGGGGTKSLLVRAIGPALAAFGLGGTLADPMMEIAPLGAANIAMNDNWSGTAALKSAFGAVGAFPLTVDASGDAALVFSPGTGAYTAKVTGIGGGTGLALVEVYDSGTGNAPRLTNVSARTQVGIGGDVLIVGFVVSGNVPKKLLIRAVGPTLDSFGVGSTLVDPVLKVQPLGDDNVVATNDDWRGTAALKSAFASVGAFPLVAGDNSRDAAIAIELPPGAYTATVSGKNDTTGVALVEVYEVP